MRTGSDPPARPAQHSPAALSLGFADVGSRRRRCETPSSRPTLRHDRTQHGSLPCHSQNDGAQHLKDHPAFFEQYAESCWRDIIPAPAAAATFGIASTADSHRHETSGGWLEAKLAQCLPGERNGAIGE